MTTGGSAGTTRRALKLCAEMEREMGGLYRDLAAVHEADADLASLWGKTAREEDNHAHQFELATRFEEELGEVILPLERAAALLEVAREMRRRLAAASPDPVRSLRAAIELEERFAAYHVTSVTAFRSQRLKALFDAMMAADRDHAEALRRALAARAR